MSIRTRPSWILSGLILAISLTLSTAAEAQLRATPTPESDAVPMQLPRFYARHVEEGNKYLAQNRLSEAMDEFFTARTINPDYYPTYIGIGDVYMRMGKIEEAVEQFRVAVRLLNPSYGSEHVLRGDYFYERRRYEEAIQDYKEVLRIDPQAGNQYALAMRHLRFGEDKKAVKAFEAAIDIDEDYAAPHFQLGNLYFRDDKIKKAVDPYSKAVAIAPQNPIYRFGHGTALYKQATGKSKPDLRGVQSATSEFETALNLGMQVPRLHYNLGTCYILTENYNGAIEHLGQAVKRGLRDEDTYYNLGNAYFKRAMTIDFKWDGYDNLTDPTKLDQNNRKFEDLFKSVVHYKQALQQKDDYAQVYYDLGAAYYRLSELKLTPQFVRGITALDPSVGKDYATRGVKFFQIDMITKSINNFDAFTDESSDRKARTTAYKIMENLEIQLAELSR